MPTTGLASVPTTGLASVPTTGRSSSVDSFGSFQTMSVADCAARSEKTFTETREIGGVSRALHERERGNRVCIHNGFGGAILVDNRLGTSLSRIPTGIFNTMVRPLPWEATWSNPDKHAAGLESPLWIVLYGLSIYGVWKHRCRLQQMVFPLLLIGAVAILGAMTHGNLGTAFRHRGQILFAFAVLAAGGLQAIADKRSSRRNGRGIADSIDDASRNQVTNPDLPDCAGT